MATALSRSSRGTIEACIPWKAGNVRVPRLPPIRAIAPMSGTVSASACHWTASSTATPMLAPWKPSSSVRRSVAIGERPGRQTPDKVRDRVEKADDSQRRRRSVQQQHDVTERRRLDPVADQRQQRACGEAPERPMPQGRQGASTAGAPPGPPRPVVGRHPAVERRHRPPRHMPQIPDPSANTSHGRSSPRPVRCRPGRSERRAGAR
jgi:hypothetical protein